MELGLQGKVAIFARGSKDMGQAIAVELAAEGGHGVFYARSAAILTEVAQCM